MWQGLPVHHFWQAEVKIDVKAMIPICEDEGLYFLFREYSAIN